MTTRGRKRKRHATAETETRKKARVESGDAAEIRKIEHPTLRRYYRQISTLRSYLISSLPDHAKSRRRKIKIAGASKDESSETGRMTRGEGAGTAPAPAPSRRPAELGRAPADGQTCLAAWLDHTLVATPEASISPFKASREKDFIKFSQQADISFGSTLDGGTTSISDVGILENSLAHHFAITLLNPFHEDTWNAKSIARRTHTPFGGTKVPVDH